jgi:hypothetical protein
MKEAFVTEAGQQLSNNNINTKTKNRRCHQRQHRRTKKSSTSSPFQLFESMMAYSILVLLSLSFVFQVTSSFEEGNDGDSGSYYQRYKVYPPYCSDPKEMKTRSIPPLPLQEDSSENSTSPNTHLVHVSAIIRHGARTPVHGTKRCWKGYWDEPDGIWNCKLRTIVSTRPYNYETDSASTSSTVGEGDGMFLIQKVYNAFHGDGESSPYKNNLNGTCQNGQLLQPGYDQEVVNGQYLRDAYIYNGSNPNHDPRMVLFDTTKDVQSNVYPFLEPHLRYRSDDDQRTVASGQILLSTMFEPELQLYRTAMKSNPIITHHTADRALDIVDGTGYCPLTHEAYIRSIQSQEYQSFLNSEESLLMQQLMRDELDPDPKYNVALGCMMTAICTDRSLPDVINDYDDSTNTDSDEYTKKYGPNRFERLMNFVSFFSFVSFILLIVLDFLGGSQLFYTCTAYSEWHDI